MPVVPASWRIRISCHLQRNGEFWIHSHTSRANKLYRPFLEISQSGQAPDGRRCEDLSSVAVSLQGKAVPRIEIRFSQEFAERIQGFR